MSRLRAAIPTVGAALILAACASPREHFYTLLDPTVRLHEPPVHPERLVIVGPVKVPSDVDRPELVVQDTQHRVLVLEQERWIEPLAVGIRRALVRDLATRLPQAAVREDDFGGGRDALRVEVSVRRLDAALDAGASLEADWQVIVGSAQRRQGVTVTQSPPQGRAYSALVAADAATIDRMSEVIAAAITSVWSEASER